MKTKMILTLIMILFATVSIAQDKLSESNLKSALTDLFDVSKKQDYNSAAQKMLFDNNSELRSFNADDKTEMKSVKRMAKRIKAYLDLSDSFSYESITYDDYKKLPRADLKVNFKSGDQDLTISFYFVDKNGTILLQDIK